MMMPKTAPRLAIFASLLAAPAWGQTVPNLPAASSAATTDLLICSQSAVTRRCTVAQINATAVLSGTTGSIGGGALAAGACASGTATVTGATTSMTVNASPVASPLADASHGLSVWAFVSASNTVTVEVCAIVATTPTARAYNVRVLK